MIDVEQTRAAADVAAPGRRRWHGPRLVAFAVLIAWAALFWFVLLADRTLLYLSQRTDWLVPAGAVVLTMTAGGVLASARSGEAVAAPRRSVRTAALLVVPVLVVAVSPATTLGSFSADRKAQFGGRGLWTYWGTFDERSEITMFFVTAAQYWEDAGAILATRAGEEVTLEGFARRMGDTPADEFFLTRFVVTCCVADAAVTQLRIVDVVPGTVEADDWVRVSGRIYPVGDQIIVTAERIDPIDAPKVPYLTA